MIFAALMRQAEARHLKVLGGFHPTPDDGMLKGCGTLLLLGPDEPVFWPAFSTDPEYRDGRADPMDRWSARVIGAWADLIGADALFPFSGPPFLPFYRWALRSGRSHASPVRLLVHDTAGLLVSFRGALALADRVDLPAPPPCPCDSCDAQPCRTACPVAALTPQGYDVPACKAYLDSTAGETCMTQGCKVRSSCPVSQALNRVPAQSVFHMHTFKGA